MGAASGAGTKLRLWPVIFSRTTFVSDELPLSFSVGACCLASDLASGTSSAPHACRIWRTNGILE
jgi:hypothetical protein